MDILNFQEKKANQQKISMITCYDYWSAKIINETKIDAVLVGDSVAMTMHGHATTIPASVEMMIMHIQAVARGATNKFIIGDLPFLSYRKSLSESMTVILNFMQAGANAIKLEGVHGNLDLIKHIVESGVPVMGHIGLTPQFSYQLGGFKVQGKEKAQAENLKKQARALEAAGCFAIVLECIPSELAKEITHSLSIPTIGIGAGPHTSGQVLVLHDMLGLTKDFSPKFLKKYLQGFELIKSALEQYREELEEGKYPDLEKHVY